ncbi:DinB family protein [Paenibacillus sp. NFR01]|uniref:DinB family protein n=1 Tax=Paenibacillus sp. NFR01 TaxID=1566279 RepID=UPI0008B99B11|nr:DinB family protein [Paenibacillus sp. NFR01]SEU09457.1 DinB superfamily protein [Paenibacillus sp. NFR01]
MDTKETLRNFEETVNGYIRDLDSTSLEQLLWKPAEDEWSLGQMYMHLIGSAQYMQLRNAALCLEPGDSPKRAEKTKLGEDVFQAGSFPPDRVRVPPSPQYTPLQPDSKEQLVGGLRDTVRLMTEIEPAIAAAFVPVTQGELGSDRESVRNTVLHPRLGGLNALEWFGLIEMHYRHHLLQKARLDNAWREANG